MSTFAATFRELVVPDLRRACRLQALSVARERCDFTAAHTAVLDQAKSRGAYHLPGSLLIDLDQWIGATILQTIIDIDARPEAAREIVDETMEGMWATTT